MSMNNQIRIDTERYIVLTMLRTLEAIGWKVVSVWDSEETVPVTTIAEAWGVVDSVDWSNINLRHADSRRGQGVAIVLGNGIDCISDWTYPEAPQGSPERAFTDAMDAITDWATDREQGPLDYAKLREVERLTGVTPRRIKRQATDEGEGPPPGDPYWEA